MSPTDTDLKKAEIVETQATAIARLIISEGSYLVYDPALVVRAVTSNDLTLLVKKDDDKGEPASDVLIP